MKRILKEQSSPPQLRRGEPRPRSASPIGRSTNRSRGWGGAGQEIQSFDQHHPGASRHPSSAEEGSFLIKTSFLLLWVAISSLCLAQTPNNAPAGNVDNGKKLFLKHDCYWCHGTAGQGSSAGARIGGTALSLQGVMRYVRQPAGAMPAFTDKVLTDQELIDIYAYLKSVQAPKTTSVPILDQLKEK